MSVAIILELAKIILFAVWRSQKGPESKNVRRRTVRIKKDGDGSDHIPVLDGYWHGSTRIGPLPSRYSPHRQLMYFLHKFRVSWVMRFLPGVHVANSIASIYPAKLLHTDIILSD